MNFSKTINQFRRTITRKLTKKIGSTHNKSNNENLNPSEIKNIFVSRPNGRLGNLLLLTPLIQELNIIFPNSKIDIFVKGTIAPTIFKNYNSVENIISLPKKPFKELLKYTKCWLSIRKKKYDIAINLDFESSSGRLSTQFSKAKYKFFGDLNQTIKTKYPDYEHIAKYPIYSLRESLQQIGLNNNFQSLPNLNLKLNEVELKEGNEILKNIFKNEKETICIFTYATGEKCLSENWWNTFYNELKIAQPNVNIIEILPVENISKINFKAPHFYSKNIREMGSVIANCKVFIGADSGIMHLSSAVQTPTIGLFSVSKSNKYKPYNIDSDAIDASAENSISNCIKMINSILKNDLN